MNYYKYMILEIKRFSADFEAMYGYCLDFIPHAVLALVSESQKSVQTIQEICVNKFHNFEIGLNKINQNTGQTVFKVDKLSIDSPEEVLKNWVARSSHIA